MDPADLSLSLANRLRAKATELNRSTLGIEGWSKKYIPSYFFRGGCALHVKLCERLDYLSFHRGCKEVFQAPRGYAKTTWASFATPLRAACEGTEKYILILADTLEQAKKYLQDVKDELDNNEELKRDYPEACRHGDIWNVDTIVLGNGVRIEALGKGNNVRGRKHRGTRPTLIVCDDPQSNEDIDSPRGRQRDMDWVDRELIPAGDTDTNYLFIGNNIHRQSIIGVLSGRPDFNLVKFSAIITWPKNMDLWSTWEGLYLGGETTRDMCTQFYIEHKSAMEQDASVLWEEKENLLKLMQMRAPNHAAFEAEKQNNPRDPGKSEFDEAWFAPEGVWYQIMTTKPHVSVGFCDPSKGKEAKKNDYTAIIDLHYVPEDNCAYVEADLRKRPIAVLIEDMINRMKMTKYLAFGVEANGFQSLLAEEMWVACANSGVLAPIQPIENYGVSKTARINRLSVWFKRGFLKFRSGCSHTKLLMEQILDHPHADHDDGPDALEGAIRVLMNYVNLDKLGINTNISMDSPGDDGMPEDNIFGTKGFSVWH